MYAVTSRSESAPDRAVARAIAVHGKGRVAFRESDGATRLDDLYQHDPVRILFPTPAAGEPPQAAIVTTSGGLVGGDVIEIEAHVGNRARALVSPQAAEKVYRSDGGDCRINVVEQPVGIVAEV